MAPLGRRIKRLRRQERRVRAALRRRLARRALIAQLPKRGVGAEIGVWKGDFTAAVLRKAKPTRLYLIDPWLHCAEAAHERAKYARADEAEMELIYRGVLKRFARDIARARVEIRREPSASALAALPRLDWAYVDGDHTYECVAHDLRALWSLISAEGCLAGDDYGIKSWWEDGVTKAVDEFAAANGCEKTIIGSQFLLRKR